MFSFHLYWFLLLNVSENELGGYEKYLFIPESYTVGLSSPFSSEIDNKTQNIGERDLQLFSVHLLQDNSLVWVTEQSGCEL